MENEFIDNKLYGYTIDLNLPWIHKQYFVRDKNIIIEFGLCLFEALVWTIYAPFMAIKDIIFAFWYLITKQWYKLNLIAFVLDICILALCAFGILFFIPGLPAIIYGFGLASLIISGLIPLLCIIINTVKFMVSKGKVFFAHRAIYRDGHTQNVLLMSPFIGKKKANDFEMEIATYAEPVSVAIIGRKRFYSYVDFDSVAISVAIIGHKRFYSYHCKSKRKCNASIHYFLGGVTQLYTELQSLGIEIGIRILDGLLLTMCIPIFTILAFLMTFIAKNKADRNLFIGLFILSGFFDSLIVFDVLFFIPGMPVTIWWIGLISLVLTCVVVCPLSSICSRKIGAADIDRTDPYHLVLYPCKRGNDKYLKKKKDLSAGEIRINAQEIKPSMGIFLPVKD